MNGSDESNSSSFTEVNIEDPNLHTQSSSSSSSRSPNPTNDASISSLTGLLSKPGSATGIKAKRQVRFPKDNNPKSLEVHLPTDEMSLKDFSFSHDHRDNDSSTDSDGDDDNDDGVLTMKPKNSPFADRNVHMESQNLPSQLSSASSPKNKPAPELYNFHSNTINDSNKNHKPNLDIDHHFAPLSNKDALLLREGPGVYSKNPSSKQHHQTSYYDIKSPGSLISPPKSKSKNDPATQQQYLSSSSSSGTPPSLQRVQPPSVTITPSDQETESSANSSLGCTPGYLSPTHISSNTQGSSQHQSTRPTRPIYRRNNSSNSNIPRNSSRYLPENFIYVPQSRGGSPDLYTPSPIPSRPASTYNLLESDNNLTAPSSSTDPPSQPINEYAQTGSLRNDQISSIPAAQLARARAIIAARSVAGIGSSLNSTPSTEDVTNARMVAGSTTIGPSSQAATASVAPNYFDVGLITSGGLAPGAVPQYMDERIQDGQYRNNPTTAYHDDVTNPFEPSSLESGLFDNGNHDYINKNIDNNGPYGHGISEHDIPLEELHNRLSLIAKKRREREYDDPTTTVNTLANTIATTGPSKGNIIKNSGQLAQDVATALKSSKDDSREKGKFPRRGYGNGNRIDEENEDSNDNDSDDRHPSVEDVAMQAAKSLVRVYSEKQKSPINKSHSNRDHGEIYNHNPTSSVSSANSDTTLLITTPPSPNPFNSESRNSSLVALPTAAIFHDHYYNDSDESKEKEDNKDKDQTKRTNGDDKHQDTTLTEDADTNFGPDRHHQNVFGIGLFRQLSTKNHGNESNDDGEPKSATSRIVGGLKMICDEILERTPTSIDSSDSSDVHSSNNSQMSKHNSDSNNVSINNSSINLNDTQHPEFDEDYVPPPKHVKQGILGSLLKLASHQRQAVEEARQSHMSPSNHSPSSTSLAGYDNNKEWPSSHGNSPGSHSPLPKSRNSSYESVSNFFNSHKNKHEKGHKKKWSLRSNNASTSSLAELVSSSHSTLGIPGYGHAHHGQNKKAFYGSLPSSPNTSGTTTPTLLLPGSQQTNSSTSEGGKKGQKPQRPKYNRSHSAIEAIKRAQNERKLRKKLEQEEQRITLHIADVLQRQRFILRLCRALMLFGAPTHRLEEYMTMTSRALNIDGQFIYIPGCMIASFGDSTTHTSEMQLVRVVQGVNLTKLHAVHQIYKNVIHLHTKLDVASDQIDQLLRKKNLYPPWVCVLIFALSCAVVGPFGFGATWVDMPLCFLIGGSVGLLQIIVAPRSGLYNNVFEISASIIVSFLARAFGSIRPSNPIFCFPAIVQSSLALILPGYIILCGSLELQSRNIVAGSVRMFYAIIYSLMLGFGITLGAAIYGWIDPNATSMTTCPNSLSPYWRFFFVPAFTAGLALVNQAALRQLPVMILISGASYACTYFSNKRLANATELTSAIGAFVIGILGNVYSRVGHGLAFAAMLPAIFVQVPSGVAAQGSLISGISSADSIVTNTTSSNSNSMVSLQSLGVGVTMVQVSIGMCVGLFVATLVVYPLGKSKSGLFTF